MERGKIVSSFLHPGLGFTPGLFKKEKLWTPALMPDKVFWIDMQKSAVSNPGGTLTISDLSGLNNNAVQNSPTSHPTYLLNNFNGLPSLVFDGSDDFLESSVQVGGPNFPEAETVVAVVDVADVSSDKTLLGFIGAVNYTLRFRVLFGNIIDWSILSFSDGVNAIRNVPGGTPGKRILVARRSLNLNSFAINVDGLQQKTTTFTQSLSNNSRYNIGVRLNTSGYEAHFQCSVAEICILHQYISGEETQLIEGYAAHRWDMASVLPNDHPYKSAPPTI